MNPQVAAEMSFLSTTYAIPAIRSVVKNGCQYIENKVNDIFEGSDHFRAKEYREQYYIHRNLTAFQVIIDGQVMENMFITAKELEEYNRSHS